MWFKEVCGDIVSDVPLMIFPVCGLPVGLRLSLDFATEIRMSRSSEIYEGVFLNPQFSCIWTKVFKNERRKFCGRQPLKNEVWLNRPYYFNFSKNCPPQISLDPFLNTLFHFVVYNNGTEIVFFWAFQSKRAAK